MGILVSGLLSIGLSFAPLSLGQGNPRGAPFSATHYPPEAYRAQAQNWDITQDERGLTYVANSEGILQYDGEHWRSIGAGTSEEAAIYTRSVAADSQGTVYAGAVDDFGVLRPDSTATLRYVSLAERLSPDARNFGDVWYTHATDAGVYFQSRQRLFRWDGSALRSWKSEESAFHTSFAARGQFYVRESGRGLLRMEGDSLQLVPGGARFAERSVYVILPYGEDELLVGTSRGRFFRYDGKAFVPFPTEVHELLGENILYHGVTLPGGEVALATLGKGVLVMNRAGQVVQVLDQSSVLPDGTVNRVYAGRQGGLWMALHNDGVARAEVVSPLSRFGTGFGLEGVVQDLSRHDGTLYAATSSGVYALNVRNTGPRSRHYFDKVKGIPSAWSLISRDDALYATTQAGLYRVRDGRGRLLVKQKAYGFAVTDQPFQRFFVGTGEGLGVVARNGRSIHLLARTSSEVRTITMLEDGTLWFSTLAGGVFRLPSSVANRPTGGAPVRPQSFGTDDGLPDAYGFISSFDGEPLFVSAQGLYRVRRTATDTTFYADTTLTGRLPEQTPLRAFYSVGGQRAWLFYDDRVEIARPTRGAQEAFEHVMPPALQFERNDVVRALINPREEAWISNGSELFRYDAARARRLRGSTEPPPGVMVREVRAPGAVFYGGAGPLPTADDPLDVPYEHRRLRLALARASYGDGNGASRYRYRLDEGEWSDWQPDPRVALRERHEGTYTVHVQGRSSLPVIDEDAFSEASLTFRVLPPWYRTVWAYLAYAATAVALAGGSRHYYTLRRDRRRAQAAVRHAERESARERRARKRLEEAGARLEEANRLKTNLLHNTSHEFRTPLASIMGYAEVLRDEDLPREQQEDFLGVIHSCGARLLNTVNMLLEVARLSAGALHLDQEEIEVNAEVEDAVAPFREDAAREGLAFHLALAEAPLHAELSAVHFRHVVENLVDNALKFTSEGLVHVTVRDEGDALSVSVRDTGIGIAEEAVERLFEEFKQASEGVSRAYEGIGLGLTIAGRLAHLMNGTIEVESTPGKGSRFTLRLPKKPDGDAAPGQAGEA